MNSFERGSWSVAWDLEDGGRLTALRFREQNLLTSAPLAFHPPMRDYGRFETRPVYGYDDCFPTVDACEFPREGWAVPDHGELCWLPWRVEVTSDELSFEVTSSKLPISFRRNLRFDASTLAWSFEAVNSSGRPIPFIHVMHCLMPLGEIVRVELPEFDKAVDEALDRPMPLRSSGEVRELLESKGASKPWMLLLQGVKSGSAGLEFRSGLKLEIRFPAAMFPTLGIWWNGGKYPDEDGCRRVECALEPIPGNYSSLARCLEEGAYLSAPPGGSVGWTITWSVS